MRRGVCYLKTIGVVDEATTKFEPSRNITKAEFIKMLVCCMGEPDATSLVWYKDVSISDWHYKYIATAVDKGILIDDGENFYPDSVLNAYEAKVMLEKASKLINGSSQVSFNKNGNLTRAEAAVAIQNLLWQKLK